MCWYKTLFQVEPVVWTSITTSSRQVVIRLVHSTGKTWYKDLYQHVHYVCNKFIKHFNKNEFSTNNKGWIKMCTILSGRLHFVHDVTLFFPFFHQCHRLLCFVSHSNDMTSCQSSLAENVSCNVAPFFYRDTTSCIRHLLSDRLLSLISKENVHNVR